MKHRAFLGIGGNVGDREANIKEALALLEENRDIRVVKVSSVYETEPVGYTEQAWFFNVVAEIETELMPFELLACCQGVEKALKRERIIRWGPRTIDVDILLFDELESGDERLILPHPRMRERAFVMIPLMEIAPELVIDGEKVVDIVDNLKGQGIRRIL